MQSSFLDFSEFLIETHMQSFNAKSFETLFLLSIILITTLMPQHALAQSGYFNSYAPLLNARSASLADAGISDPYDVYIMYLNPGALTNLSSTSIILNHSQEKSINGKTEGVAMPIRLGPNDVMAIGLIVNHTGYTKENIRPEFKIIQYGYNIAYSRQILPSVSFGTEIGVRYTHSKISSVWTGRSSLGFFYSPSQEISYGVTYNGIGNGVGYTFDGESTLLYSTSPPRSLQAGLSMHFPSDFQERVLTFVISNEKVFGQSGIIYKGGIEYFPLSYFALRAGYKVAETKKNGTFGCGIKTESIKIDFSISPSKSSTQAMFISISLKFWK